MSKNIKNEIIKKSNELLNINLSNLDFDEVENYIRLLSPNIYKAFDKLVLSEKLYFVNNENQYRGENLLLGDLKDAINHIDVSKYLTELLNKDFSIENSSLYFGLGFIEWNRENGSFEKYKLPLILIPIKLVKQESEFFITTHFEYEKIIVNPKVNIMLSKTKNIMLPKIDTSDKLYTFFDKLSTLCEENNLTLIEEGVIFELDITNERLYFTIDKMKDELQDNGLLEYLFANDNDNEKILEKLGKIDKDTKLQDVLDYTIAPFFGEEINPILLTHLNFSYNLEYSTFYGVQDVSNINNVIINILSTLINDDKKVLFVGSEDVLNKLYDKLDGLPIQNLVYNASNLYKYNKGNEGYKKLLKKEYFNNLKDWDNRSYIFGNKDILLTYNEFLNEEILPLKTSVFNAIKKYFEYKETCDEIDIEFQDIKALTMLDIHQYLHDLNFFVKNYEIIKKNAILENIWFTSNLVIENDKDFTDIYNRLSFIKEETLFFIDKFEKVKAHIETEYTSFGTFYSFCNKVQELNISGETNLIDFEYSSLKKDIDLYNKEVNRVFEGKEDIYLKFEKDIENIDFLSSINDLEKAFEYLYRYINYSAFSEDELLNNIDKMTILFDSATIEIERIKSVYFDLENIFDFKYEKTISDYEILTNCFEVFYGNNIFKKELLNGENINTVVDVLEKLLNITDDIKVVEKSIRNTFKDFAFSIDYKEIIQAIENLENQKLISALGMANRKEKEFIKSLLRDERDIKDLSLIKEQSYELILLNELNTRFDLLSKEIEFYFDSKITVNSNIVKHLENSIKIKNIFDLIGVIPEKLKDVLTGKSPRNTAINELFRKMSLKYDYAVVNELEQLFTEKMYRDLFLVDITLIDKDLTEIKEAFFSMENSYKDINKYTKENIPSYAVRTSLRALDEMTKLNEENEKFFVQKLKPYMNILVRNNKGLVDLKNETATIVKGKKLGLSFEEIQKIVKLFENKKIYEMYDSNDSIRFTNYSLEVSWLIDVLNLDFEVKTFDQLRIVITKAYNSFKVVMENEEYFKVLLDKDKVDVKDIVLTLYNNVDDENKYIDTFMISFYRKWIEEVSWDKDFSKKKLDDAIENVQRAVHNQSINNSYKIYEKYSEKLIDIDFNKKYYDEVDEIIEIYNENVTLRGLLKDASHILQLFKPVIFITYEKLMKLDRFINIDFDTVIIDKYNDKNFIDILPYFNKVRQSIFLYNTTFYDNYQVNIPTIKLKNFLIEKESKVVKLLNEVTKNNFYNILGVDKQCTYIYKYDNDMDFENKTSVNEVASICDVIKDMKVPCNVVFPTAKQREFFKKQIAKDKIKLNYNVNLYVFGEEFTLNEELIISLNDKELNTKIDGSHLNLLFNQIANAKKVTLVTSIEKVVVDDDLKTIDKNFKMLVKYLIESDINNINSVEKYSKTYFNSDRFSLVSDIEFDFYDFYDKILAKDLCKYPHGYLWSFPFVVEKNFVANLKSREDFFNKNVNDETLNYEKYEKVISSQKRLFEKYETSDLYDITPAHEEDEFLINAVLHILRLESPICCSVLYEKVSKTLSGIYSIREIENRILNLCSFTLNSFIKKEGNFFWNLSDMSVKPRYRDFTPNIFEIATEERMLALFDVAKVSIGITTDNLLKVTLYELGFTNITSNDMEELKVSLNELISSNILTIKGNKVKVQNK
ncbi:MAG: DUF4011 domain-containing protein [Lachnospirales bacterium]